MLVTLDTQTVESLGFDLEHRLLRRLLEECVHGTIDLVLVDLTNREIERRIERRIRQACSSLEKAFKGAYVLKSAGLDVNRTAREHTDFARLTEHAKAKWNNFLFETDGTILSSSEVNIDNITSLYFDTKPPFSEKKPREFPDAIMLERLRLEAERRSEPVHIVSDDKDIAAACDGQKLIAHNRITGVLRLALALEWMRPRLISCKTKIELRVSWYQM